MTQNYRHQNESGRSQDYPRPAQRAGSGRDRYETGNERRYSPDWEDRFYESSNDDDNTSGFTGDRSYSAGGYAEEFGYRRDNPAERERGGASYYDRPGARYGRHPEYGGRDYSSRDYGSSAMQRSQQRTEPQRHESARGEDFNRGRGGYFGSSQSSSYSGGSNEYGGSSAMQGRGSGSEHSSSGESGRQQQSSYRGRGPKGYERSDERLREIICERLTDDPYIDASEVTVEVNNKVVKLTGTVDDRRVKYQIEDLIEQCGGVRDIDNQLRVQSQYSQSAPSQGAQAHSSQSQYGTALPDTSFAARSPDKSINPASSNPGSSNPGSNNQGSTNPSQKRN